MSGILGIFEVNFGVMGRFLEILAVFWVHAELFWQLSALNLGVFGKLVCIIGHNPSIPG
jgi:hypothetical protein